MLALALVRCGQRGTAQAFLRSVPAKFFPEMLWPWHIAEAGGYVAAAQALSSDVAMKLDDGEAACPAAPLTEYLFASLERSLATTPALAPVKAARGRGDNEAACRLLSAYYDTSPAGAAFRLAAAPPAGTGRAGGAADAALNDTYDFYGEVARVPRNVSCDGRSGGLDWFDWGPIHDEEVR